MALCYCRRRRWSGAGTRSGRSSAAPTQKPSRTTAFPSARLPAQFRRMNTHDRLECTQPHTVFPTRSRTHARILRCCRAQVLATAEKMRLKGQVRSTPPPHAVSDAAGKIHTHIYVYANCAASQLCTREHALACARRPDAAAAPLSTKSSARKARKGRLSTLSDAYGNERAGTRQPHGRTLTDSQH
jgi:hypothetical protein